MTSQVSKSSQQQREVETETQERHAKASTSAGLNLNLFGALSGALSSHSRKETHRQPSGEETSVEERDTSAVAQGQARGQGSAFVAAEAEEGARRGKGMVDHLGIEG